MSIFAGPVRQIGLVVRDIDSACHHWARALGVGPFILFNDVVFDNYVYRGSAIQGPRTSIAVAQSGGLQIELIQPLDQTPSAYREFLAGGCEGMQHISCWLDSAKRYDEVRNALLARGMTLVQEGNVQGVDVRFSYFSPADNGPAPMFELSEAASPVLQPLWDRLQAVAAHWDGKDLYWSVDQVINSR